MAHQIFNYEKIVNFQVKNKTIHAFNLVVQLCKSNKFNVLFDTSF